MVAAIIFIPLSLDERFIQLLNLTPSSIGLALSQVVNESFIECKDFFKAITMMGSINVAIRKSALAENELTSVERIFEYTKLAPEQEIAPMCEKK